MTELAVIVGVLAAAAIALLVWAVCRISGESDKAMDKAMRDGVSIGYEGEVITDEHAPNGVRIIRDLKLHSVSLIRHPQLGPESKRRFEEPEADDDEVR
jgi:hypothetical protein